jgi:uncharacterized protein YmfQ (DUF2313 family)
MSRIPDLRAADYLDGLANLLPRGRAWSHEAGGDLGRVLAGMADPLAQLHARAVDLLEREADPARALELLPEWEAAFGLPDPCIPAGSELTLRRAALLTKIAAQGGQTCAYLQATAAALGFDVTLEELRPYRVGDPVGAPLRGPAWRFALLVHAPALTIRLFTVGTSAVGDPLRSWANTGLECVLRRIAPAHTRLIFSFGS